MLLGSNSYRPPWFVALTLVFAATLNVFPTGWFGGYLQPNWLALVLIFWCLWEPERYGAGIGWLSGLLLDVLDYGTLGQHALAMTVCGFIANRISLRLRAYPIWQQCVGVGGLVAAYVLIIALVEMILDKPGLTIGQWFSPFSSLVMWPLIVVLLHRRRSPVQGF